LDNVPWENPLAAITGYIRDYIHKQNAQVNEILGHFRAGQQSQLSWWCEVQRSLAMKMKKLKLKYRHPGKVYRSGLVPRLHQPAAKRIKFQLFAGCGI
jgi:hypothetical protein